MRASSPPSAVPGGMAASLQDEHLHGRTVLRVGVYGGALERRCVPSARADPLCGSMYGVWVPDTRGPLHTHIASKSFQCDDYRQRHESWFNVENGQPPLHSIASVVRTLYSINENTRLRAGTER